MTYNYCMTLETHFPISPVDAARMCSAALGEPESTWSMRLANGRRPERESPIPWERNEHDQAVYQFEHVQGFIDRELSKRAASIRAEPGKPAAKATAVADTDAGVPFVRLLWNAGVAQGAFGLTPEAARSLAEKLLAAANAATKNNLAADPLPVLITKEQIAANPGRVQYAGPRESKPANVTKRSKK